MPEREQKVAMPAIWLAVTPVSSSARTEDRPTRAAWRPAMSPVAAGIGPASITMAPGDVFTI